MSHLRDIYSAVTALPIRLHYSLNVLHFQRKLAMKKAFRVPDMMCSNCAMHLEGLEDELDGIKRISASYKKQTLDVEFDETKLTVEEIIAAANEIGYHPELIPA
jgi:copper chaperone